MTIYTENYTAKITFEELSFDELRRVHWECEYEEEHEEITFMEMDFTRFEEYEC